MVTEAYVLIKSDLGAEHGILKEIVEILEVREAYQIYGVYDIIVRIETGTIEELKDVVELNIRRIQNVHSTLTMIIIDAAAGDVKHVC